MFGMSWAVSNHCKIDKGSSLMVGGYRWVLMMLIRSKHNLFRFYFPFQPSLVEVNQSNISLVINVVKSDILRSDNKEYKIKLLFVLKLCLVPTSALMHSTMTYDRCTRWSSLFKDHFQPVLSSWSN